MKHKDSRKLAKREEAIERRLDRSWRSKGGGPVLREGSVRYEVSDRVQAVGCGGIGVMRQLVRNLGLAEAIDRRVGVLKRHLPYHESDHVLNLAYNILSGGECLQDVEGKRRDPAYLDALGARKLPAASTEGDFLRRFEAGDAVDLHEAANEARLKVWALQPEEFFERATLDVDGTTAPTGGECKEGIGLNHEGVWGYGPLVVSLAETGEALYTVNRPANRASHEGFAEWIDRAVDLARRAGFRRTRVRGDTDFALTVHFDHWTERGVEFVFGKDAGRGLVRRAEAIPESAWADLERKPKRSAPPKKRKRRGSVKREIVRENGYRNLTLERERVAEIAYRPARCAKVYRLVVLRKTIKVEKGQERLFDEVKWFFYITNVPASELSAAGVVLEANARCAQENVIEQLKNGVKATRAPSDTLEANWAWLATAALAWNLKIWLALVLPMKREAARLARMEFRRFLRGVILAPCQIVKTGRRTVFRLLAVNEWTRTLLEGSLRLSKPRL